MSDAYQRNLETNVSKLIESYKTVLKKSALDNTHAPHENLQITAAAAAIVYHAQSLLDQIEMIRMHIILQGPTIKAENSEL